MKGRRNDPLTRRWADETALNPHLFANLKLISQLSVSTCHFADWFQTVFVIFKKKSGIGCEICIFCYSRFEKYGHPFTSGALILYKLVVRSWPVICVYIFSLMSFFLNCMLEVGTIFPAALSCFLFSSGASTRLQLMAFTYGVPQSHLLDTHTHTHTRACALGRIPLDEWSARHRELYMTTHNTHRDIRLCPRWVSSPQSQQTRGHRPIPWTMQPQLIPQFAYLNRRQWRNIVTWMFSPNESCPSTEKLLKKRTEKLTQKKRCLVKFK